MVNTGGAQRHPADTERLMEFWSHGSGAAKIQWEAPGAFERCKVELGKYVSPGMLDGLCSNLGLRATGARPGSAAYNEAHGHKGSSHG